MNETKIPLFDEIIGALVKSSQGFTTDLKGLQLWQVDMESFREELKQIIKNI